MSTSHPPRGLQGEAYRRAREELEKLARQSPEEPALQTFGPVPELRTVPSDIDKLAADLERLAGGRSSAAVDVSPLDLAAELEKAAAEMGSSPQRIIEKVAALLVGLEAQEQVLEEMEA